jgi:hypothetical protein
LVFVDAFSGHIRVYFAKKQDEVPTLRHPMAWQKPRLSTSLLPCSYCTTVGSSAPCDFWPEQARLDLGDAPRRRRQEQTRYLTARRRSLRHPARALLRLCSVAVAFGHLWLPVLCPSPWA